MIAVSLDLMLFIVTLSKRILSYVLPSFMLLFLHDSISAVLLIVCSSGRIVVGREGGCCWLANKLCNAHLKWWVLRAPTISNVFGRRFGPVRRNFVSQHTAKLVVIWAGDALLFGRQWRDSSDADLSACCWIVYFRPCPDHKSLPLIVCCLFLSSRMLGHNQHSHVVHCEDIGRRDI